MVGTLETLELTELTDETLEVELTELRASLMLETMLALVTEDKLDTALDVAEELEVEIELLKRARGG